jgi:hypothetical protein
MITNISLITLWVTDQDAARDFYVEKLGFVPRPTCPWATASGG